jgi:hypothetical protein
MNVNASATAVVGAASSTQLLANLKVDQTAQKVSIQNSGPYRLYIYDKETH